ncbi:MAG TPA: ferritin-like domain-containing protein [Streptosporangiaceae bacterium]|nr:ferritin-like domain-containing protein [Streptosporangiaceae bacterium]
MSGTADASKRGALQAALAALNAAIYGYGVAGAHLPTTSRETAQQDWVQHQATRDTLETMLTSLGAQPLPAQDAYRLPFPVHSAHAAVSLAGYLENQLAAAYLGLVALDDARLRAWGAQQAQACALRATTWLGRTAAFPGLSSRASRAGSTASAQPSRSP